MMNDEHVVHIYVDGRYLKAVRIHKTNLEKLQATVKDKYGETATVEIALPAD